MTTETHEHEIQAAVAAAERWLGLIDDARYGESYDEAGALLRGALPRDAWEHTISGVRGPLGALKARAVQSTTYATELPGAPDGEYVVILFDTSWAHKQTGIETVTPMREPDGIWRVSGYYIR